MRRVGIGAVVDDLCAFFGPAGGKIELYFEY